MHLKYSLLFMFVFLWFGNNGLAQQVNYKNEIWKLVKDIDNIQVYTRKSKNSNFKEIRIQTVFEANIDTFFNILNDPNTYTGWVYKCTEGKTIRKKSDKEFYYYTISDLPFPAQDRDMVVHCKQWKDKKGTYFSHSEAAPNYISNQSNLIRIPYFKSDWKVIQVSKGKIKVDYIALVDPGGSIPIWMVNLAVTTGPIKTIKNLIQFVQASK